MAVSLARPSGRGAKIIGCVWHCVSEVIVLNGLHPRRLPDLELPDPILELLNNLLTEV